MTLRVCVEQMQGNWIAHAVDLPGCFCTAADLDQAVAGMGDALRAYRTWCEEHQIAQPQPEEGIEVREIIREWRSDADYEVNAFFADDRAPVAVEEVARYSALLRATRADLTDSIRGLGESTLTAESPDERWPIDGVLRHVATAEWWYLDRLELAPARDELPQALLPLLEKVRQQLLSVLPQLPAHDEVVTRRGESWTARKVLRRALWHERDHTSHIEKLKAQLQA